MISGADPCYNEAARQAAILAVLVDRHRQEMAGDLATPAAGNGPQAIRARGPACALQMLFCEPSIQGCWSNPTAALAQNCNYRQETGS
jgi:hypothetical protein